MGIPVKKQPKYRNKKVVTPDGIFDSTKEYLVWLDLKQKESNLLIQGLQKQVVYKLEVNGMHICKYIADFVYLENHVLKVVDVKSEYTRKLPVYRLKFKLMQAIHGITITEF